MRWSNSGACKPPYGPAPTTLFSFLDQLRFRPRTGHPRHWGGNDLFFWRSPPLPCVLMIITETLSSSHLRRNQIGHENLWLLSGPRHTERNWVTLVDGRCCLLRHSAKAFLSFIFGDLHFQSRH